MDLSKLTFFGVPLEQLGFDTVTPVRQEVKESAEFMFEMFRAYRAAGFTESQALSLIALNVANAAKSDE